MNQEPGGPESSQDMFPHKSFAISSAGWSSAMRCAVGEAVCSLLMMAVDSEMKHSRWDSGTQFSKSVP
jgi:hypothetical protein